MQLVAMLSRQAVGCYAPGNTLDYAGIAYRNIVKQPLLMCALAPLWQTNLR